MAYETLPFASLDQEWAVDVARRMRDLALTSGPEPRVDEVWVSRDLALQVRYHLGSSALAARFGRLDVDPTSWSTPSDSARLASDLFHNLHAAPDAPPWRDELGYGWWGDEPEDGWPTVADRERLLTLR